MRFVVARRRFGVAWLPLSLQWRRPRRKRESARIAGRSVAAAVQRITWLSHIHLHFAALPGGRARRDETRSFAPAAVTRELQRMFHRRQVTTMQSAASTTRVLRQATRVFRTIRQTTERMMRSVAAPRLLPPAQQVHRIVDRRTHLLIDSRRRDTIRTSATTHERTHREHLVARELRIFRELAAPLRHARAAREESTNPPGRVLRAPDLVWRRAPQSQHDEGAEETPRSNAPVPLLRPVAVQDDQPPRRATRARLEAADFDSSLLDRLTDDVIRRVERRSRIERERRGL